MNIFFFSWHRQYVYQLIEILQLLMRGHQTVGLFCLFAYTKTKCIRNDCEYVKCKVAVIVVYKTQFSIDSGEKTRLVSVMRSLVKQTEVILHTYRMYTSIYEIRNRRLNNNLPQMKRNKGTDEQNVRAHVIITKELSFGMDSFVIACLDCLGSRCISFRKRKAIRVKKIE